jgi:hypothetical protein
MKVTKTLYLCLVLQILYITTLFAQSESSIKTFEKSLYKRLNNEIHYNNHSTEIFSINLKVNSKGNIDSTLISLSAPQSLRDRLNLMKADFDYSHLKKEIARKKWYNTSIIIPIYIYFESTTVDTFTKIIDHVNNKLNYSFVYDPVNDEDYLENCIVLKPLIFVFTQPVR